MNKTFKMALLTAVAHTCCFSTPAIAQGVSTLEEIVVTATRREQSLSDVPISVSAFSQERMDIQGVRTIDDIVRLTPGFNISRVDGRNSGAAQISIRGIASQAGSATTGIYIDDTPIQVRTIGFNAFSVFPQVFDLERVEILRGPQGTLFGAGSQGGTLRFITPRPDEELSVYSRAEIASTSGGGESYEAGAAVGGPITRGSSAFRVSAYQRHDGGYVDHINYETGDVLDRDANWTDTTAVKATVEFKPTDRLSIIPSIYYQHQYINDTSTYWEAFSDPDANRLVTGNSVPNWNRDKFVLGAFDIYWDFDTVSLTSNTSYFKRTNRSEADYAVFESALWAGDPFFRNYTPADPSLPAVMTATGIFTNEQENWTQELRLQSTGLSSRLDWVVGLFYSSAEQQATQLVEDIFLEDLFFQNVGVPFPVVFGQGLYQGRYTFNLDPAISNDEQIAFFGNVDFHLTEKLTLTAGVRVSKTMFDIYANFVGPVVGPPAVDTGAQEETPVTPKVGVQYRWNDDTMLYASASKGYRIGGYNPKVGLPCGVTAGPPIPGTSLGSLGLSDRPALFDSDTVWSYELGAKTRIRNQFSIDFSAFYIQWDDIQQTVALPTCGFFFVDNLGAATSRGFDVQAQFEASNQLLLMASLGYTDAYYNDTIFGGPAAIAGLVFEDDNLPVSPWNLVLAAQYDLNVFGAPGFMRGDYQLQSKISGTTQLNPASGGYDPTIPGRPDLHTLNLRAGVTIADRVNLSVFVNNVLDASPLISRGNSARQSGLYTDTTFRPRTLGLTIGYNY
jgi:outer membrane receptor protein involved in Fe transport